MTLEVYEYLTEAADAVFARDRALPGELAGASAARADEQQTAVRNSDSRSERILFVSITVTSFDLSISVDAKEAPLVTRLIS